MPKDPVAEYRWFQIALHQGKKPAEDFLSTALKDAEATLTVDQRSESVEYVADWMTQHGGRDVFVFSGPGPNPDFPLNEYYAINIPSQGSSLSLAN